MALLGIEKYILDFKVLDTNDPKFIILLDTSTYLTTPEKPLVEVTPPGYTGYVEFSYAANSIITIDSNKLGLTAAYNTDELSDLPDGVYQIAIKICPYEEFYIKKCYLKYTNFLADLNDYLKKLDTNCSCNVDDYIATELVNIFLLLKSAEAEAYRCSVSKSTEKLNCAIEKLEALNNLNCE